MRAGAGAGVSQWAYQPGFWTFIDLDLNAHCSVVESGYVTLISVSLSFPICKLGMIIILPRKVDERISEPIGIKHLESCINSSP